MNQILASLTSVVLSSMLTVSLGTTNSSWEHHIREDLLENYDRKVRPVLKGKKVVEVSFALRVSRLVKVDNQEQLVVLDTWVIQNWNNEFLTWNASQYDDVDRVHFDPSEIWVPDLALFNNNITVPRRTQLVLQQSGGKSGKYTSLLLRAHEIYMPEVCELLLYAASQYFFLADGKYELDEKFCGDDRINLAGGTSKFVTDVAVDSKGRCVWSGPATFKVNCEMRINDWPFDEQTCQLAFGSYTYGKNLLKIRLFKDNRQFSTRFVRNGDWDITNITPSLNETDHGNCCPFKFSEVVYTLTMKRKYLYYMFYVFIPSVLLTILALSSFLIHVESGERIGFVTTILLAMTVFLLFIPSFLPVTSEGLPVLGVNLQATMILIAVILFANIFVLRVYFLEGTPPTWVEKFCNFFSLKKGPEVRSLTSSRPSSVYPSAAKSLATTAGIELNDFSRGSSPLVKPSLVPEFTWRRVSMKLDQVFFVVFIIISSITYAVTFAT